MRILITGGNGLTGNALRKTETEHELIFVTRQDADLTKEDQVHELFAKYQPDAVIHTAAFVGGVGLHKTNPWDLFYQNILMNTYVIKFAVEYKVKKLLAFSSICAFPDGLPVLKEELMHAGEPPIQNYHYGHAKRAIDIMINACRQQYGITNYTSITSTNIFGYYDDYDLQSGHVIPSLIHKMYVTKRNDTPFKVWGDGQSIREFIFADDLAEILMKIIDLPNIPERIIVSNPKEYTIKEMVEMLCRAADYPSKEVIWETDKPNGQRARPTDLTLLRSLIGEFKYTDMNEAIARSYQWFVDNYTTARL